MKTFLLDLWHDLREKRMLPVAVLLVGALVAVPFVLAKPATEPPPATAPAQESAQDSDLKGLAKVVLAEDKASNGSKLNLFDSSDPFRPPKSALKKDDGATETGSPSTGLEQPTGDGTTGGGDGGTGIFGGDGGGTDGGGSTPTTPTQPTPKTKTTKFTYVIDATFVHGNHTRKIKGFKRLEMLPNQDSPLLVFLGVDAKANNAVFLVDARLNATGEGKCKPSNDDCSFLYLGAGSQELFTIEDTGDSYGLRIDQIRRLQVGDKKSSDAGSSKKQKSRSAKRGSRTHASSKEPFVPPLLADLVTETADDYEASRPSGDSR